LKSEGRKLLTPVETMKHMIVNYMSNASGLTTRLVHSHCERVLSKAMDKTVALAMHGDTRKGPNALVKEGRLIRAEDFWAAIKELKMPMPDMVVA
jgi:hypothetical protein